MSRLDPADVAAVTVLLSPERLSALTALTGSAATAIELHQETLTVSAGLMNVIASIEIALRNAVSENLAAFFGSPRWLTHPPAPFQWRTIENDIAKRALSSAQRAEYAKMTQAEKGALDALAFPNGRPANTSHLKRAQMRYRQIPVSEGKIIAETTFYLWKRLYSGEYDQTLWRTTLKRTFPNRTLKRPRIAEQLEHIYQARNRLAHHEPVLHKRFRDAVAAIEYVAEHLNNRAGTPAADTPLARLIAPDLDAVKAKAAALHARLDSFRTGP